MIKLQELRRGTVRDLLFRKRRAGLSKNTVRLIRATLSVLLGDAVDDELLETNVTVGGRRGRRRAETMNAADRVKAIKPMSLEQLATLLAVADASSSRRDAMLFLTLADAGLRPGEALALTWEDFDVVDRTVRIERAVSGGRIKPTKTDEARNVDLTPRLAEALSQWQAHVEAEALMRGAGVSPLIFARTPPLSVQQVAQRFRRLLTLAALPRFRLYDLRHTFATHLLSEGAPITYVAAQLGHRKPTTTLAFYAHWIPGGDKTHIDRLAAARLAVAPKVPPAVLDDMRTPKAWHQSGAISKNVEVSDSQLHEEVGSPGWARTSDFLINSEVSLLVVSPLT